MYLLEALSEILLGRHLERGNGSSARGLKPKALNYTRWPFIMACNEPRPLIRISPVLSKMARDGCNSGHAARGRAPGRARQTPPDLDSPQWLPARPQQGTLAGNVAWARWQAAACVTRIRRKNVSASTFGSFGDCCLVWPKPKAKGLRPAGAGEAEVKAGVRRWFVLQRRCYSVA